MATGPTSGLLGVDFTAVYGAIDSTTPERPGAQLAIGTKVNGPNASEYVFVKNSSSSTATVAGDVLFFTTTYTATELSTSNDARGLMCGVSTGAIPASGYGWAQVAGYCSAISVLASCAANARLNTTATAGALDDDGTGGSMQVQGIYLSTARAASPGTAPGFLDFPFVDATL